MRLIDAEEVVRALYTTCPKYTEVVEFTKRIVASQPSVDAVKVVRCDACRYYNSKQVCELFGTDKNKDGYCDEAVRRWR